MSGFRCQFCKGSLTKVHYPKLYNMAHLIAFNVLLLPKDLTIIFSCTIFYCFSYNQSINKDALSNTTIQQNAHSCFVGKRHASDYFCQVEGCI